jgi:hypothetical protein
VNSHLQELRSTPTYVLELNAIRDEGLLTVVKRSVFDGSEFDPELVNMAQEVAASHNWPISAVSCFAPGGGGDACLFDRSGIRATGLACLEFSTMDPCHHTRNDTPEHVRPESLSVMLQLVIDMIQRIDNGEAT